jgi:hypothetical protein
VTPGSFAPPDNEADEPKDQKNYGDDPEEMQRKSQTGEQQDYEECEQQQHRDVPPLFGGKQVSTVSC